MAHTSTNLHVDVGDKDFVVYTIQIGKYDGEVIALHVGIDGNDTTFFVNERQLAQFKAAIKKVKS